MNKIKKPFFSLVIFFMFFIFTVHGANTFTINNPNYFNDQDKIFDEIHYLDNEMLSIELCAEGATDIEVKATCVDKSEEIIPTFPYFGEKKECYYSNYNLNKISCDEFELTTSYNQEKKLKVETRYFKKEKESKLLNYILNLNSNSLDPVKLSNYLFVYTEIHGKDNQKTTELYDELKSLRDNSNKCWPKGSCSIEDTLNIINNLKESGFSADSRLIADGIEYIKTQTLTDKQIQYPSQSLTNSIFEVEINVQDDFAGGDIDCDIDIDDGDEVKSYTFDSSDDFKDKTISKSSEDNVEFTCDQNVDQLTLTYYEDKLSSQKDSNQDILEYTLSTSEKDDYNTFTSLFVVEDDFAGGDIKCDITVDGDTTTHTFTNTSTENELKIENEFEDEVKIDCDQNVDILNSHVFAGEYIKEIVTNTDTITHEFSSESSKDKFPIEVLIDYDFSKDKIICEVTQDSLPKKTYSFSSSKKNSDGFLTISNLDISEKVTIVCDEQPDEIIVETFDKFNKKQLESSSENQNSLTSSIPSEFSKYSCIPDKTSSKVCNFQNSLLFLKTLETTYDEKTRIQSYVSSLKVEDETTKKEYILDSNKYSDSGKYLEFSDDSEVSSSLKFEQNNDGSWGSTPNVEDTSHAVLGLQTRDTNSENVKDGKHWIYFNEPTNGWGSIEKNTLAYLAIKEQLKPYIIFDDINQFSSGDLFTIKNPTIFSLQEITLDFSPDIKEHLAYKENLGDLTGDSSINFSVVIDSSFSGKQTGELIIKGFKEKSEIELLRIPVTLETPLPFTINPTSKFIEGEIFTPFSINSSSTNFSLICTIENPFEDREEQVTISSDISQFTLSNIQQKTGNYTISLECLNEDKTSFSLSQEVEVSKIDKTFTSEKEVILMSEPNEFSLAISNTFSDKQTLLISVEGDFEGILVPAETSKILAKNETRDIYFTIENKDLFNSLNENSSGNIILTAKDYTKKIPLQISSTPIDTGSSIPWVWITIIIIVLGFIGLVIKRYRELQQEEESAIEEEDEELFLDEDLEFH